MAKKKQSKSKNSDGDAAEFHLPLQAILLANSLDESFQPITMERPKVLLPLVDSPMLDYSLAWLYSIGVREVYVVCSAHSKQIIEYLEKSNSLSIPEFTVTVIASRGCVSTGDALRLVYERDVIHEDFVLVSGDTVTNIKSLTQVLQGHKERKRKDSNAIMTMVVKPSKPLDKTRRGENELVMGIDSNTKELMYYEDSVNLDAGMVTLGKGVEVHNDKEDCHIDVCSPEVLSLFADNFDYQHLRHHLVKELLSDDIMGYKIYTHEIPSCYAARVDNFGSYDTVSRDIIQGRTRPWVPDLRVDNAGNCLIKEESKGVYKGADIQLSSSAHVGPFSLVGRGTSIGNESKISNSVIGKGCCIGSNVSIEGSYIWDNVTIQDGCQLRNALVCDGVVIKAGAILEPGLVLSFKLVVEPEFHLPAYSRVSLHPQPANQDDGDEEFEYAGSGSGFLDSTSLNSTLDLPSGEFMSTSSDFAKVAVSGASYYIWTDAPKPEIDPGHAGVRGDGETSGSDNIDDPYEFDKEVEATFLRAVHEGSNQECVILEVTSLRLSYNKESSDCAGAIIWSVMKLALETPHSTKTELLRNAVSVITAWRDLLRNYLPTIDEEIEIILKFEEMCFEFAKDFAPMFAKILEELYEKDILTEEAILRWEFEKKGADASDKVFVNQSQGFIQWLRDAEEED